MTIDSLIMKKFSIFFLVALATMLIACSSDYENYVPETEIPEEPTETISFTEDELLVLTQMRNPDNRICIDEATEIALNALNFFGAETSTRSGQMRSIAGVTALRGEPTTRLTTRSADGNDVQIQMPDTVAFVINFADEAGFTIVAADTRITSPVLAFVKDGYLDLSEEIDHPGLAVFFAGMEEYIEWSIIEAEQLRESLLEEILAKMDKIGVRDTIFHDDVNTRFVFIPDPGNYVEVGRTVMVTETPTGNWTTVSRVGPLLPVEWGQGFPFNHLVPMVCPDRRDGRAPAGCDATAAAMIMAYWRHPAQIDGFQMNWDIMNRFTARPDAYDNVMGKYPLPAFGVALNPNQTLFKNNVARLMERIGVHIGTVYGCGGSTANSPAVIRFLRSTGYTGGEESGFNLSLVLASLSPHRRPVLIRGDSGRNSNWWIFPNDYWGGHAWVIDGYLRRSQEILVTVTTFIHMEPVQIPGEPPRRGHTVVTTATHMRHQLSPYFLHNNWGWNGSGYGGGANGFFVAGGFDSRRDPDWTSSTRSDKTGYFRYRLRIYTNIRR